MLVTSPAHIRRSILAFRAAGARPYPITAIISIDDTRGWGSFGPPRKPCFSPKSRCMVHVSWPITAFADGYDAIRLSLVPLRRCRRILSRHLFEFRSSSGLSWDWQPIRVSAIDHQYPQRLPSTIASNRVFP